jgi:glycerophosphoryl diester phosphodiesterase
LNKYLDKSKPLIIAHRGESFDAPENTMAAINLAWERGAEAVEIDVQLSEDYEVEIIHVQYRDIDN